MPASGITRITGICWDVDGYRRRPRLLMQIRGLCLPGFCPAVYPERIRTASLGPASCIIVIRGPEP
jgi:hypothetical protein